MADGVIPSGDAWGRVSRVVRHHESRDPAVNERPPIGGRSHPFEERRLAKATEDIAADATGEFEFWTGEELGSETATGNTQDGYTRVAVSEGDWLEVCRRSNGWEIVPIAGGGGGGVSNCNATNEVWFIYLLGSPTGGTWSFDLTVDGTEETMGFNFDDTATEVATELATHTNVTSSDVAVTGGPLPDSAIRIEFTGDLATTEITPPNGIAFGSLTGGSGVGVIITRWTKGIAA